MTAYSIHITKTAQRDVMRTVSYIDTVLKNPIAADALINEFEKRIQELSSFPEKYALAKDPMLASWGIRFLVIKNYLAFYLVDRQTETVHVVRFLYGKSNWVSVLQDGISFS